MKLRPEFHQPLLSEVTDLQDKEDEILLSSDLLSNYSDDLSFDSMENLSKQAFFTNDMNTKFLDAVKNYSFVSSIEARNSLKPPVINIINSKGLSNESKKGDKEENSKDFLSTKLNCKGNWQKNYFKSLIFNVNVSNEIFDDHLNKIWKGLKKSQNKISDMEFKQFKKKLVKLRPYFLKNKNLFFELEQTLISNVYYFKASDKTLESDNISIKLRPYCLESLNILSEYYNIYIFTNKPRSYTNRILNIMDPNRELFCGCLTKAQCIKTKNGHFIKDLRVVWNEDLNDMVIVDHISYSFASQIDNGIPILPWNEEPNDCELKHLTNYLVNLSKFRDVRVENQRFFKLQELALFKSAKKQK